MTDYRVRFKQLLGPRRPAGRVTLEAPAPPGLPAGLRVIYTLTCASAALGWLAVVAIGRSSPPALPWLEGALALFFPVSALLVLGFSKRQGWTRPLLVGLRSAAREEVGAQV